MAELDEVIAGGVAENAAPFVVSMWGRAAGPEWSGAAGDAAAGRPAAEDTVFRIFSMTKAVGAFAAAQMIDRGAFSLDTPVEEILPEWREIQVLEGMDGATPRLRAPKTKATIRNLATHTTGNVYEFWNADIQAWMGATEHPTIVSGLERALSYPLVFDPGARWDYGIGIDWLGRCVERVDGRRIDQYCREEIFEPLGMPDTGFEVSEAMRPRLAEVRARGEDGAFRAVRTRAALAARVLPDGARTLFHPRPTTCGFCGC
jgi:Beta-lactamase class C and other penicillin binding proteins